MRVAQTSPPRCRCRSIISHPESISIMWPCSIDPQPRIVALRENAMGRTRDQVAEEDGRLSGINQKAAHFEGPGLNVYLSRPSKQDSSLLPSLLASPHDSTTTVPFPVSVAGCRTSSSWFARAGLTRLLEVGRRP
ncbi:hypothetical protein DOTSEDRAFT_146825 [Dothistroma septosporum NZE10]|uniref:Uncharacterized protein n=1 Tax=Dothistroma septosporum (strain NZE10 / CBS 128990) TaxID=675120 RepID=N1Q022_DOTSN|nr:hypothetical protein DOTSEDRAFT_146825 [Dothistroma septosporum NZE10]